MRLVLFERIYRKREEAPWTFNEPPRDLVDSGIKPCKVLDIGCGEGHYSTYLASKGFDVLGVDTSEKAIEYSRGNARKAGVDCRFELMDVRDLEGKSGFGVLNMIITKEN